MRELSVLIVDDDAASRRGLQACVDWKRLNMRVVGEAINGRDALSLMRERGVDIVLSDVRMPFMDGLELSKIIGEQFPAVKTLLISGYGEIDYLKSALQAQVLNYILKPIDVCELETSLKRAAEDIEADDERRAERAAMIEKLHKSMPLLQERFLRELIEVGILCDKETHDESIQVLGLDMPWNAQYFLMLARVIPPNGDTVETHYAALRLGETMREYAARADMRVFVVPLGQWEYALIYRFNDAPREDFSELAQALLAYLKDASRTDVDIGVGVDTDCVKGLRLSYHIARQALIQSYFLGHNNLLYAHHALYETDDNYVRWDGGAELEKLLISRDTSSLRNYLHSLFIPVRRFFTVSRAQKICLQMMTVPMRLCVERIPGRTDLLERAVIVIGRFSGMDTFGELESAVCEYLMDAQCALSPEDAGYREAIVREMIRIIEEKFATGITIKELAEVVSYSPAYIAHIFRTSQGITINDYLTGVRMRRAEQLLRDPRYRLYEIARMVGYADNKYFSKLFKKHFGALPSEYRESFSREM